MENEDEEEFEFFEKKKPRKGNNCYKKQKNFMNEVWSTI
jgi:hypothetical protein